MIVSPGGHLQSMACALRQRRLIPKVVIPVCVGWLMTVHACAVAVRPPGEAGNVSLLLRLTIY